MQSTQDLGPSASRDTRGTRMLQAQLGNANAKPKTAPAQPYRPAYRPSSAAEPSLPPMRHSDNKVEGTKHLLPLGVGTEAPPKSRSGGQQDIGVLFRTEAMKQSQARSAPPGMRNHGNTCYLNATLQVLLSLAPFTDDMCDNRLRCLLPSAASSAEPAADVICLASPTAAALLKRQAANLPLTSALASCLDERVVAVVANTEGRRDVPSISPLPVKLALAAFDVRWRGVRQQDAHEFLVSLLDHLQGEVLAAQVGMPSGATAELPIAVLSNLGAKMEASDYDTAVDAQGVGTDDGANPPSHDDDPNDQLCEAKAAELSRRAVLLSDAVCPVSRTFSGCLQHDLTCQTCGFSSQAQEQFYHLSLQLPTSSPLNLKSLLETHFKDEVVEKECERCGAASVPHTVKHTIRRLPRVFVVHLKRFNLEPEPGGQYRYFKLHAGVQLREQLSLAPYIMHGAAAHPLLLSMHQFRGCANQEEGSGSDSDKENKTCDGNVEMEQRYPSLAGPAKGAEVGAATGNKFNTNNPFVRKRPLVSHTGSLHLSRPTPENGAAVHTHTAATVGKGSTSAIEIFGLEVVDHDVHELNSEEMDNGVEVSVELLPRLNFSSCHTTPPNCPHVVRGLEGGGRENTSAPSGKAPVSRFACMGVAGRQSTAAPSPSPCAGAEAVAPTTLTKAPTMGSGAFFGGAPAFDFNANANAPSNRAADYTPPRASVAASAHAPAAPVSNQEIVMDDVEEDAELLATIERSKREYDALHASPRDVEGRGASTAKKARMLIHDEPDDHPYAAAVDVPAESTSSFERRQPGSAADAGSPDAAAGVGAADADANDPELQAALQASMREHYICLMGLEGADDPATVAAFMASIEDDTHAHTELPVPLAVSTGGETIAVHTPERAERSACDDADAAACQTPVKAIVIDLAGQDEEDAQLQQAMDLSAMEYLASQAGEEAGILDVCGEAGTTDPYAYPLNEDEECAAQGVRVEVNRNGQVVFNSPDGLAAVEGGGKSGVEEGAVCVVEVAGASSTGGQQRRVRQLPAVHLAEDSEEQQCSDDVEPSKGGATGSTVLLNSAASYRLHGIVSHKGSTPFSGHYIADIIRPRQSKSELAQWDRYDDEIVRPISATSVMEEAARQSYLLFFVAQGPVK